MHVVEQSVTAVKVNDRNIAHFDIDPIAEKKLLRKLDLRVVPVLWVLFLLAFLDRTNIGTLRLTRSPQMTEIMSQATPESKA